MASNEETGTFTVPVGTRLSHGIELEILVAYLYTSEFDPDDANSSNLAPILRVEPGSNDGNRTATVEEAIQEHIRTTLRNHGIRVLDPTTPVDRNVPLHLHGVDQWDVTNDITISDGWEEHELVRGKPGRYRWFGLELRSPACWDEPGAYDEIRLVVNLLKSRYRVRVNPSCGFHVHVANGPGYFDTKTLKRAGAFLFAADPMLSRLHAPWRRVGLSAPTLRHTSRLARWDGMTPADAQVAVNHDVASLRQHHPSVGNTLWNDLPALPWSDRSREEMDFGGRDNWERYANERVRDGPHITLNRRPLPLSAPSTVQNRSSTPAQSSPLSSLPPPPSSHRSSSSPSSDDSNDGNVGGAHYRRLLRRMASPNLRRLCFEKHGHEYPEELNTDQQYMLLMMDRCQEMYGHISVGQLTDDEFASVVLACGPYVEVSRSAFEWNQRTNGFTLSNSFIGLPLGHPRPLTRDQLDADEVVAALEGLAQAQEAEGEEMDLQDTASDTNEEDEEEEGEEEEEDTEDDQDQIMRNLYERIDQLMAQPTFPLDSVDELLNLFPEGEMGEARVPNPTPARTVTNSPSAASEAGGSSRSGSGGGGGGPGSPHGTPSSSSNSDNEGDSRDSSAPSATGSPGPSDDEDSEQLPASSSSFLSDAGTPPRTTRISDGPKLQPHDVTQLPDQYIFRLAQRFNLQAAEWFRISWLPYPGGPEDPADPHPRDSEYCAGRDCREHVVTDTRTGLATILEAESGAAVAQLLLSDTVVERENYNFAAYAAYALAVVGEKRTLEFREAGGSLDLDWIITWTKVCVGILRFCRDARVADFMAVLERVVREEERQRVHDDDDDAGDADMYDVCDLLEDLRLFAEATTIRERERTHGPPR